MLENPQVDRRAKAAALDGCSRAATLAAEFLRLLARRAGSASSRRCSESSSGWWRRSGQLDVELTTAYELSEEEMNEIVDQIARASGRSVRARVASIPTWSAGSSSRLDPAASMRASAAASRG